MATLLLAAAGSYLGGTFIGGTILGMTGAAVGQMVGASIGAYIDGKLFAPNYDQSGPRLKEMQVSGAAEGAAIPQLYGRSRLAGQVIWATKYREVKKAEEVGGKGGGGQKVDTFSYRQSFAVCFGEGTPRMSLGRVWADGNELDLSKHDWEFYPGGPNQLPDDYIESIEGVGNTPAYRGLCYIVFKDMDLSSFGDRMPNISAELTRPVPQSDPLALENTLRAVTLIPASGEFAYGTSKYLKETADGGSSSANTHTPDRRADLVMALDQLQAVAPNVESVMIVTSWFGTDLRAGECKVEPRIEGGPSFVFSTEERMAHTVTVNASGFLLLSNLTAFTTDVTLTRRTGSGDEAHETTVGTYTLTPGGEATVAVSAGTYTATSSSAVVKVALYNVTAEGSNSWRVSGLARHQAKATPIDAMGNLIYGGTPSDVTLKEAIAEIKRRGLRVVFYPFVLMTQLAGNGLPDPYGATEQPSLPWRGRITCHPAPGYPGTVDKTATAQAQIDAFFGPATVSQVGSSDGLPTWSGSATDFGYRRMILHYARLCQLAGGVDAFLVGTELRGLTFVRSSATSFPAVAHLRQLAQDVKGILGGGTKVSYAADWSEYNGYRPGDGTNDLFFHLDPLWADPSVDFVGIDNYLPLSDFRDGDPESVHDRNYLMTNVEAGELYDYYYASDADRSERIQTPITDGAYGEPWAFRQKDLRNWWLNAHHNRPGGVRSATPTAWVPQSKPVWFTEFGCAAIDKGSNQPNVFYDPKSSESFLPYFSNGKRDDQVQRAYNEATIAYWLASAGNNPVSSVYGGRMLDTSNFHAWTWDARPFPQFPGLSGVWADGANYDRGHWLNGRLGLAPLSTLVKLLCERVGITPDVSKLYGPNTVVQGFTVEQVQSPRELISALALAYNFDGFESGGSVRFALRQTVSVRAVSVGDLVVSGNEEPYSIVRQQETELPAAVKVRHRDPAKDYAVVASGGDKLVGGSQNVYTADLPLDMGAPQARSQADVIMQEAWVAREKASFALPPSLACDLTPADVVRLTLDTGRSVDVRLSSVDFNGKYEVEGARHDVTIYDGVGYEHTVRPVKTMSSAGASLLEFMELPLLRGDEVRPWAPRVVAFQAPWPGGVDVYRSPVGGDAFTLKSRVVSPAALGVTYTPLYSGPVARWDVNNTFEVRMLTPDKLVSVTDDQVLAGKNALAIRLPSGRWEVLQFASMELLAGPTRYRLSRLLRGQAGTDTDMVPTIPVGSRVVFLDATQLLALNMELEERSGSFDYRYGPASAAVSDKAYKQETRAFLPIGLRPYSPAQVRGKWAPSGDVSLTWTRRTRIGGDSWDGEVPLSEDTEAYEVEVRSAAGVIVRTFTGLSSPSVTYTAAQQAADFGSAQTVLRVRVYQLSTTYGRGAPAKETIYA